MSRSGYSDDSEMWSLIRWRGAVKSAIRGKRGQQLLKELLAGLDAMEKKELIADELEDDGCFCALGVVGKARGLDMSNINPEESEQVAKEFNIANALAREIVFQNDEGDMWGTETNSQRWNRVRRWVESQIEVTP